MIRNGLNAQSCPSGNSLASTSAAFLSTVLTCSALGHVHSLLEYLQPKTSDLQKTRMAELVFATFVQAPSESRFQPAVSKNPKEALKRRSVARDPCISSCISLYRPLMLPFTLHTL
jgi:hypothetical protein